MLMLRALRALRALRGKTVFQKFAQAVTNFNHSVTKFKNLNIRTFMSFRELRGEPTAIVVVRRFGVTRLSRRRRARNVVRSV